MRKEISLPDRRRRCHCLRRRFENDVLSPGRKVSRWCVHAGSLTVEAAWALPLFFLAVCALIAMMELYGLYAEKVVALQEQAETAAAYASLAGDVAPSVVEIRDGFVYRPRFYPEVLPGVTIAVRARARPWVGRISTEDVADDPTDAEELVYLSDRATVYHTSSSCTHLALSVHAVAGSAVGTMHNEQGGRYHACEKCVGSGIKNSTVYITDEGDRFHNSASCSSLTRSVRLVKRSEAEDLPLCSRCQALENAG